MRDIHMQTQMKQSCGHQIVNSISHTIEDLIATIVHNACPHGCHNLMATRLLPMLIIIGVMIQWPPDRSWLSHRKPINLVATKSIPSLEQGDVMIRWPLDRCMFSIGRPNDLIITRSLPKDSPWGCNNLVITRSLPTLVFAYVTIQWPLDCY